jgi:hypothetical protein
MSEIRDVVSLRSASSDYESSKPSSKAFRRILASTVIISLAVGFIISNLISGRVIARQEFQIQTSGSISISEAELYEIAKKHELPIYWSGPIAGYNYLLALDEKGSSILKYIPESGTAASITDSKREIATYNSDQAWEKSLIAANTMGLSNFKNADGSLVFYSTNNASDVFMAFEGIDVQVEIFDSRAGQALSLALLEGEIRPVFTHEDK